MPFTHIAATMERDRRSEIEDELKWVEDNIPSSGDAGYLGSNDDIGGLSINQNSRKQRARPEGSAPGQSSFTALFVFFVTMVVALNLALWMMGTNEDQNVPSVERGFVRQVPDGLGSDDDVR